MESENIVKGLDSAITTLNNIKGHVLEGDLQVMNVVTSMHRDVVPVYDMGNPLEPVSLRVQGPTVTTIEIISGNLRN